MHGTQRSTNRRAVAVGLCLVAGIILAVGVGLGRGTALGQEGATKARTPDPYQDLPTDARATAYIGHFNASMARRAQWIHDFQASGKDASRLPRAEKMVSTAPGEPSLAAALQRADLVVEGTIARVIYTPSGTTGIVRIGATHKASDNAARRLGTSRPAEMQVALGYSPEPPSPNYPEGVLAVDESEPLLLPGARAFFFLQEQAPGQGQAQDRPAFYPQGFSGSYEVNPQGKVVPARGNPFGQQMRDLTPGQFTALIVSELNGASPTPPVRPSPTPGRSSTPPGRP